MGAANSNLPTIAYLTPNFIQLAIPLTAWMYSHNLMAWGVVGAIFFWQYCIRLGAHLQDPFQALVSPELENAYYVWFVVLGTCALVTAILSNLMCYFVNLPGVWPLYSFLRYSYDGDGVMVAPIRDKSDDPSYAEFLTYEETYETGLSRWGYRHICSTGMHLFATFVIFLIAVVGSAVLYEQLLYVIAPGWAYLAGLGTKVLGYIAAWIYWSYRTDLYTFGPTAWNTSNRETKRRERDDDPLREADDSLKIFVFGRTQQRINKAVAFLFCTDFIGFLLVAGLAIVLKSNQLNGCWIAEIVYISVIFLVVFVIALIFRDRQKKHKRSANRTYVGKDVDEVTEETASVVEGSGTTKYISQYFNAQRRFT